jgi:hypothetical protein
MVGYRIDDVIVQIGTAVDGPFRTFLWVTPEPLPYP